MPSNLKITPHNHARKAGKKLRRYVESHDHAIRTKAGIMVDHFHEQVLARRKIGGWARAMIICSSIKRAIQYFEAVSAYLRERKTPYHAIVAFSDFEQDGRKITGASLNGFPGSNSAARLEHDRVWKKWSLKCSPTTRNCASNSATTPTLKSGWWTRSSV